MPAGGWSRVRRATVAFAAATTLLASAVSAAPYLVADADNGQVLLQRDATEIWYPASLTKLMTVYVALDAVRAGRLTMDTPLVMSARAARMPPSKMGFRPGTQVTLDNALKMLMVKSPNDVAVMIAEGISGSVPAFANEMNATAARLGLHESHFVNPNGLHNPDHYSSARDMAMIARALLHDFPEDAGLFSIGELQLANQIIRNHNGLLGRYPGADGMKTGFTCPAGFNVVATANHWGRHLIVVVMGSPSAKLRTQEAADLFDRGFAMGGGSATLESLASGSGEKPGPQTNICRRRSAVVAAAADEDSAEALQGQTPGFGPFGLFAASAPVHTVLSDERPDFNPVPVFVGAEPGWNGPVLSARGTDAVLPKEAKAYVAETPDASAPAALKSVVKTPTAHRAKGARHAQKHMKPLAKPPTKTAKSGPAKEPEKNSEAQ